MCVRGCVCEEPGTVRGPDGNCIHPPLCPSAKAIPKLNFTCSKKNGLFPHPDNCNTFIQCSNGEPHLMTCPNGLHYSYNSRRCEKPCDAYCDKSLSCECKWPTCGLNDLCSLLPDIGPCKTKFYYNYYFNRSTGQCEAFLYSGCPGNANNFLRKEDCEKACPRRRHSSADDYLEPSSEESTEQPEDEYPGPSSEESTEEPINESIEPISEESTEPPVGERDEPPPEQNLDPYFECGPDDLYPHPKNCRSFVKCVKRVPTLKSCPAKLHFNNATKRCEPACKAYCDRTYACECGWPTCGTNLLCSKPAKPGSCRGKFERFYFDKRSGECETFNYSGCLGNENNFLNKGFCERKCKHSLDICKLPPKTGICKGKFERYYFNHEEGKCKKFSYGGCHGNHNKFKTLRECEDTCLRNLHQEAYPLLGCVPANTTWGNKDDCTTYFYCKGSGDDTQLLHCPSGQHFSQALKRCVAPCDAYCEPSLACKCGWPNCKKTEDFTCVKDGLFRDPEKCSSYIHCVNGYKYDMPCPTGYHFNEWTKLCEEPSKAQCQEQEEKPLSALRYCHLPAEKGRCPGNIPRWYYIPSQNRCWMFSWGGCGGNGNNFMLKGDCESACMRRFPYSEEICRLPAEKGPCKGSFHKYYFNHEEGKCTEFIYGGCQGNDNKFDSMEECEKSCLRNTDDTGSDTLCAEDGVRPDFDSCSRYINCSNGQRQIVYCPRGLHFNEATNECDSPCDARCNMALAMECGWPIGGEENVDFKCAEDGKFPDIRNCRRYIECSNGQRSVKSCPPGLHFNEKTGECDSPCDARCDQSLAMMCGWPMGGALKCPTPDGKFPYPGNDRKYIECVNNKAEVKECQGYQLFDFTKEQCVFH